MHQACCGIVIKETNRALLKKECFVVYLSSSVEQLVKRTAQSKAIPLLEQSDDREKTLRNLLEAREGFYQEVADVVVDTTSKKLYAIINELRLTRILSHNTDKQHGPAH
jgi:shikimate kinase